ncbi:MAG: hypothetical protein ACOYMA_07960, partial [Bacteroidia bacterium]
MISSTSCELQNDYKINRLIHKNTIGQFLLYKCLIIYSYCTIIKLQQFKNNNMKKHFLLAGIVFSLGIN